MSVTLTIEMHERDHETTDRKEIRAKSLPEAIGRLIAYFCEAYPDAAWEAVRRVHESH